MQSLPLASALLSVVAAAHFLSAGNAQDPEVPPFWTLVERLAQDEEVRAEFEIVLDHMAGISARRSTVGNRLSRVTSGLAKPWTPPALSEELLGMLSSPASSRKPSPLPTLGEGVADWLDYSEYEDSSPDAEHPGLQELAVLWSEIEDPARDGLELLQSLSSYVALAHALLDEALADMGDAHQEVLFGGHAGFLEAHYRGHFPGAETGQELKDSYAAFKSMLIVPESDRKLILAVGASLLHLAEPAFLNSLPKRLNGLKTDVDHELFEADTLAVVGEDSSSRVLLTGRKDSEFLVPAALRIDLGGDDTYRRAAVVDSMDMLVSVVIDLGGNDTFTADGPGPAFAAGGAALLVDRKGEDRYVSTRLGQAASVLGFAALIDHAGDDEYVAEDFAQGHATCGVALLYDMQGNDTYTAWAFAQGGGIGYGLCALVDAEGDDRYLADLHWPDVYGNSGPDVYHGASQGYSTGLRPEVAGGIAALLDLGDGQDRYQSGSFAQGGGYYFSFGLMYDGGGDDENFGSRYSQGFGVHQAVGVRWDAGGDDQYTCRSVAHTGMAWDEGVGYLIEDGGDDVYKTGDLSCGGAAQTGVAVHLDRGGADSYTTGRQSQGGAGSFQYHNKPALGILIDLGGKQDKYTADGRSDATMRATRGIELFLDAKARDMQKALRSKLLR